METTLEYPTHSDNMSENAFAESILNQRQSLYRLALSMLHNQAQAEDAVAETIYRAYAGRHRLRKPDKLKAWLFQILVNQCRSQLRKKSREIQLEELLQEPSESEPQYGLWELVQQLPDNQQSVIVLYYYEGYSIREIAKLLKLSEGNVRTRMSRGREKLKQWLEKSV